MIRTLTQAAAWIETVGLAPLFPKADVVLPSLWEQVNGSAETNWAVRDADGGFVAWTDEMGFLWSAKDELPARGLACVGKHLARVATCVAPSLVPTLVAAAEPYEPEGAESTVVDAVTELGALTGPALREAAGLEKKAVERAVASLHRRLVLTNSHLVDQDGPWGALAHDLLARKWKVPRTLPGREDARRELALRFLDAAGEMTAADLAGPLGWRRTDAAAVLDEVAEGRDGESFRIWARR
ncbi:MAG: DNA glycosylase AlkZ-like family protein [Gaiellaceae bacterium]